MKTIFTVAFVAAGATQALTIEPLRFTGFAQDASGAAIKDGIINANNQRFWLGKPATTACGKDLDPLSAVCDSNTKNAATTIFSYTKNQGVISLDVIVPSGQLLYVAGGDGALGFAPGGGGPPRGAKTDGFKNVYDATLKFEDKEFWACPVNGADQPFQLFAQSRSAGAGCKATTFKLKQVEPTYKKGPAKAYQYV